MTLDFCISQLNLCCPAVINSSKFQQLKHKSSFLFHVRCWLDLLAGWLSMSSLFWDPDCRHPSHTYYSHERRYESKRETIWWLLKFNYGKLYSCLYSIGQSQSSLKLMAEGSIFLPLRKALKVTCKEWGWMMPLLGVKGIIGNKIKTCHIQSSTMSLRKVSHW